THNAEFGGRGTGDFQIEAGNSIGVGGTLLKPSVTITDAVVILMGTLSKADASTECPTPIPPDIFNSNSGLNTGAKPFGIYGLSRSTPVTSARMLGLTKLRYMEHNKPSSVDEVVSGEWWSRLCRSQPHDSRLTTHHSPLTTHHSPQKNHGI